MKNAFKIIGICALTCFSFYYTDKVIDISRSKDPIMQQIMNTKEDYKIEAVNASIKDDTMIPGKSGTLVDVKKSYEKMKKLGEYNENLLVFVSDLPKISISNNYDKYIVSGNKLDRKISLIFKVNDNTNLIKILNILKNNNIVANFFIDNSFIEENNKYLEAIINENHQIGSLGNNLEYNLLKLKYAKNLLMRNNNYEMKYCYSNDNNNALEVCSKENMYTIKPKEISNENNYTSLKEQLENGLIVSFDCSNKTVENLNIMLNYIKQKGYTIVSLDELIKE